MQKWFIFFLLLIFGSGCSSSDINDSDDSTSTLKQVAPTPPAQEEKPYKRSLSEVEKVLLKPGKYHGSAFNLSQLQNELDKLPHNWNSEQYMDHLIQLLAEDYRYEITTIVQYDPQVILPPGQKESIAKSLKEAKIKTLIQTKQSLLQKAETEYHHLQWAQKYLVEKWGKDHPIADTKELIDQRYTMIQEYVVTVDKLLNEDLS